MDGEVRKGTAGSRARVKPRPSEVKGGEKKEAGSRDSVNLAPGFVPVSGTRSSGNKVKIIGSSPQVLKEKTRIVTIPVPFKRT